MIQTDSLYSFYPSFSNGAGDNTRSFSFVTPLIISRPAKCLSDHLIRFRRLHIAILAFLPCERALQHPLQVMEHRKITLIFGGPDRGFYLVVAGNVYRVDGLHTNLSCFIGAGVFAQTRAPFDCPAIKPMEG